MNLKLFTEALARNVWIMEKQTADVTHEESLLRPPFRGNSLNWVLGHILVSRQSMLSKLGHDVVVMDEAQKEPYRRGSEPLTDGAQALPLETLMMQIKESQSILAELLPTADLTAVIDDDGRTLGDELHVIGWHETYHAGQLELLRQVTGKNDVIIP